MPTPQKKTKPTLNGDMPLLKAMCATCPFRPGSPYANLAEGLAHAALTNASRVCHSTGSNNVINKRTGKPPALCRGARNVQLEALYGMGFLEAATDEAWEKKFAEMFPKRVG